jgi:hypothetical protein
LHGLALLVVSVVSPQAHQGKRRTRQKSTSDLQASKRHWDSRRGRVQSEPPIDVWALSGPVRGQTAPTSLPQAGSAILRSVEFLKFFLDAKPLLNGVAANWLQW